MKTKLSHLVLGLSMLSPALGFSQLQPCNTFAAMEQRFAADPQARARYEAAQQQLLDKANAMTNNPAGRTAAVQFTIPVVFHILHMGGAENINDQTCIDALAQVNRDYSRNNADTTEILHQFKAGYINSDIKFMLAHKDPNGNCTSGIVHQFDTRTNWNQIDDGLSHNGHLYPNDFTGITWDPTKYLNVFIVKQIIPTGTVTGGGIIVGYTYVPGTWSTTATQDAVVYNYNYLQGLEARSLSHEFGHWLGLKHTFGNTNNPGVQCADDGITDTPVTKGNFSNCPNSSTNTAETCYAPNATTGLYYENVQNFMDYSSCPRNFTTGQTNVMRATLGSNTSGRVNVTSANNLIATDVNGVSPCAPIAEYLSTNNAYTVCANGSLNMKDFSYNGVITSYQWTGDNSAMISAPTASATSISFPVVGTVNVTLAVSNSQGNSSRVRQITVIDGNAPGNLPPFESFENPGVPPHWAVINATTTSGWDRTEDAAYDGTASYYINGSAMHANESDYLQMPIMNLAASTDKNITFAIAYAKYSATQNDVLKVQGSKDCGGTWIDLLSLNASQMSTNSGGVSNAPYTPTTPEEWKTYTISTQNVIPWTQFINSSSVLLRFNFTEGSTAPGNNFFIDAIKTITTTVGINQLAKNMQLNVYPNPSNGEVSVHFKLDDAAAVKINVTDIYGRVVLPVVDSQLSPGQQTISINKSGVLSTGIYFIDMRCNGAKITTKLIIE